MRTISNAKTAHIHGHIQLIIGPVYSGKTTELLRRVERYKLANRSYCIVRYKHDPESQRHKQFHNSCCNVAIRSLGEPISVVRICDIFEQLNSVDVIAIDEGHFFEDIAESADCLAQNGKIVLIAALDGDFLRKRFTTVMELFPRCENICKLSAVCTGCGNDASFSCKITDPGSEKKSLESAQYSAVCRRCYFAAQEEHCPDSVPQCDGNNDGLSYDGQIEIIFGPMFSGKTTEMLRRRTRHALASRTCKVVKYAGDTRYDICKVTTHDQLMQDAISASKIGDVFDVLRDYEVILIDEGQFFPDIVEYSELLANLGKAVIVSSLDGDFNRKEFQSGILDLCSLAEDIVKLKAVCTVCGNDAAFTCRMTSEKKQEVIGGKEMYRAMCRFCYMAKCNQQQISRAPLHDAN